VSETQPYTEETIERFDRFRSELQESLLRQQRSFDQAVLKLAAAGLALTVTLATALASKDRHLTNRWSFVLAWAFLAGSIASVLISFVTSQIESQRRIDAIDDGDYERAAEARSIRLTRWLNYSSGAALIGGGIFLAVFITINA
jgi:hypothetical protein